jgi:hypothetical protein
MTQKSRKKRQALAKRIEIVEVEMNSANRGDELLPDRLDLVQQKVCDPLNWMMNHTETKDPHWREAGASSPYRPFPDKPYFRPIIEALQREAVLFLLKSRDMMLSWLVVGYFVHDCMIHAGVEVLFQSQTEAKAAELVDYAKCLYNRQDSDIKERYPLAQPLAKQSSLELNFGDGNRIVGLPHGTDKIRSYHPSVLFLDEAAFIPDAEDSFNEALPAVQKIVVLSSAGPGFFEQVCVSAE